MFMRTGGQVDAYLQFTTLSHIFDNEDIILDIQKDLCAFHIF